MYSNNSDYTAIVDDHNSVLISQTTNMTSNLWRSRNRKSKHIIYETDNPSKVVRAELVARPPWQSTIVICYDFVDNAAILSEYVRFDGGIRLEKILADMDSLAANVAYAHADNNDGYPIAFVTATIDRIDMKRRFPMNKNLIMEGKPTFVGKSSINISIKIKEKHKIAEESEELEFSSLICSANFVMVAKDETTGKSTTINDLDLDDEQSKRLHLRSRLDFAQRKQKNRNRLSISQPTHQESAIIHKLWMDTHEIQFSEHIMDSSNENTYRNTLEKYNCCSISDTKQQNVAICQPQNLNLSGKIFGGYLIEKAFQLARVTAYHFIGGVLDFHDKERFNIDNHPVFVSSDEIIFEHPVSIGSVIKNEAYIACTDAYNFDPLEIETNSITLDDANICSRNMIVLVRTFIQEPGSHKQVQSNQFSFTFVIPEPLIPMKRVIPISYEESMMYIFGKRVLQQTAEIAIRDGNSFAQYL